MMGIFLAIDASNCKNFRQIVCVAEGPLLLASKRDDQKQVVLYIVVYLPKQKNEDVSRLLFSWIGVFGIDMNFKSRKSLIVVAAIAALAVGAFVCWNIFRGGNGHRESSTEITAVSGKSSQADGSTGSQPTTSESGGYGTFPEVSPDENPAIKASVESIRTGKNPERVSLQIAPKPFDANAWQTDENYRKSYLETVEPGRCYQSAQPGKGVPVLASVGKRYHELIQGETTTLKCRALPGAPVTFTSFDGGWFSANKMTSITVKAGEDGIAKAEFEAIPGTINSCRVLIASPLVTGQLEQKIWIAMPKQASAAKTE